MAKELENIESSIAKIDKKLSLKETAMRGFVYGIFQILGATVGVAILFFVASKVLRQIQGLPVIGKNQIIEIVLQQVDKQTPTPTPNSTPTPSFTPTSTVTP